MIKYKLINTHRVIHVLNSLANTKLPITLAYKLTKILRRLAEEAQNLETMRKNLCLKYGEQDENGNFKSDSEGMLIVKDELVEDFRNEFSEFNNLDAQIDMPKLNLSELDQAGIKLSPTELVIIEDFIEE